MPRFKMGIPQPSSVQSGVQNTSHLEKVHFKKIKTERLLNEEGHWNLVEKSKGYDPAEAHMQARKNVNTKSRKTDKKLAAHFDPNAKDGQDGKIRVLRMESKNGRWGDTADDYKVASSNVSLPKWVVAQQESGKGVVGRISSLFGGDKVRVSPVVKSGPEKVVALQPAPQVVAPPTPRPQRQVQKSLGHKIVGGVITPPKLPSRRFVSKAVVVSKVATTVPVSGDVIIPKRKPVLKQSLRFPTARDVALKVVPKPPEVQNTNGSVSYIDPQHSSGAVVTQLRSGQHSGKVRLVVELSSPTQFKAGVDDVRGVLLIKVLNANWGVSPQDNFGSNSLLGTYVARKKSDNSTLLEIRLKKKARIIYSAMLRPNEQSQYRIVVDLEN